MTLVSEVVGLEIALEPDLCIVSHTTTWSNDGKLVG